MIDLSDTAGSLITMDLSPQAFSTTHGSTMLHSFVFIKICMNHIIQLNFYSENPIFLRLSNVISNDCSKCKVEKLDQKSREQSKACYT